MGRSGGGGGGGGRSGGGGGGGRSGSAGGGGGHRSGGGGGFRSSSGGSSGYSNRHRNGYYNGGVRVTNYYGQSTPSMSGTIIAVGLVVVIGIVLLIQMFISSSSGVAKSTIERIPLPAGSVQETGYYTDDLQFIDNKNELEKGMKYFYNKTGVQPYLYITDSVNSANKNPTDDELANFADAIYNSKFQDEAHCVFLCYDDEAGFYRFYIQVGSQAKTVIDNEAQGIMFDYMDRYYLSDMETTDVFARAFEDSADRIMKVTKSPLPIIIIIALAVVLVFGVIQVIKVSAKKKKEADERTERILNTPVDTIEHNPEIEDLENKYEGE